jgi:hypothetical protein
LFNKNKLRQSCIKDIQRKSRFDANKSPQKNPPKNGFSIPQNIVTLASTNTNLSDHLGNVRTVVSAVKQSQVIDATTITTFTPKMHHTTDYSAFGAALAGRSFVLGKKYRFGLFL